MVTLVSRAVVALVVLVACGTIHNWPQSTVQRARRPEAAAERLRSGSQRVPIVLLRAPAATGPLLASMLALIALGTSTVLGAGWLSATTSYDATDHAYDRAVTVLSAQMESGTVSALVRTPGSTIATNTADDVVKITKAYSRPSGATMQAQRAAVQGQPCVDCGNIAGRQVADHVDPLVKEYCRTGSIDLQRMRSIDAVQPQCPTCSARQGGELSHYSVQMRKQLGLE